MNEKLDFTKNGDKAIEFVFSIPFWELGVLPAAHIWEQQQMTPVVNFKVIRYNTIENSVTVAVLNCNGMAPDDLRRTLMRRATRIFNKQ